MITKAVATTGGVSAGTDMLDILVSVSLAAGATLAVGTPIARDLTQLPAGLLPKDAYPNFQFLNAAQPDAGVLVTSANAGDLLGIFQGLGSQSSKRALTNTTGQTQRYVVPCRTLGIGWLLAGALTAGTAVTIGANAIVSSSNLFATIGARVIGATVGKIIAYPISTMVAAAISSGSQTVTPTSMVGISTSTPLLIDFGTTQETVTPSAITTTTFTATFGQAHAANAPVKGIVSATSSSLIPVPGSGSTSGLVLADIKVS